MKNKYLNFTSNTKGMGLGSVFLAIGALAALSLPLMRYIEDLNRVTRRSDTSIEQAVLVNTINQQLGSSEYCVDSLDPNTIPDADDQVIPLVMNDEGTLGGLLISGNGGNTGPLTAPIDVSLKGTTRFKSITVYRFQMDTGSTKPDGSRLGTISLHTAQRNLSNENSTMLRRPQVLNFNISYRTDPLTKKISECSVLREDLALVEQSCRGFDAEYDETADLTIGEKLCQFKRGSVARAGVSFGIRQSGSVTHDPNTGIFQPSDDSVAITAGGNNILTFANGNPSGGAVTRLLTGSGVGVLGNARGQGVNDLQASRITSDQVAAADYSSILGGQNNLIQATAAHSIIAGGLDNDANGTAAVIGGGQNNTVDGNYSSVLSGRDNTTIGQRNVIAGGGGNSISGAGITDAGILGGSNNQVTAQGAAVVTGRDNRANGVGSAVLTGRNNVAVNNWSSVLSGQNNTTNRNDQAIVGTGSVPDPLDIFVVGDNGSNAMTVRENGIVRVNNLIKVLNGDATNPSVIAPYASITDGNVGNDLGVGHNLTIGNMMKTTYADIDSFTTIGAKLTVNADADVTGNMAIGGNLTVTGTVTAGSYVPSAPSDRKLKTNIRYLNKSLNKISQLQPVSYIFKPEFRKNSKVQFGFIAQDIEQYFPELVSKHPSEDYKMLNYTGLISPTIQAVKELKQIIDTQTKKIRTQQKKIDLLTRALCKITPNETICLNN